MATYVVGDIQGCFQELETLLGDVDFSPKRDVLIALGDLVNRGPASLDVLRWFYKNRSSTQVVLGNHDLHLLAVAHKARPLRESDTLDEVLGASDSELLLAWLAEQPLLRADGKRVFVHAGILPAWDVDTALRLARGVEERLASKERAAFLLGLYAAKPDTAWRESLKGDARHRTVVSALTRMRVCTVDGDMDLEFSGAPENAPTGRIPWFIHPRRKSRSSHVYFGHWAALGLRRGDNYACLDTGCAWGRALTALRLEDDKIFQVAATK